jgi:hypothetical protein
VVCQLPFLFGAEGDPVLLERATPGRLAQELSRRTEFDWRAPPPGGLGAGDAGTDSDLVLQQYAGAYAAELAGHFPHRLTGAEVAGVKDLFAAPVERAWGIWMVARASVDLWSLGVGMVTVVHEVEARTSEWDVFRDGLEAERGRLRTAPTPIAVQAGRAAAASLGIAASPIWGQLLWMHVIVLVEASPGTEASALDAAASAVSYGGRKAKLDPTVQGVAARFNLDACVAYVPTQCDLAFAASRVTAAHTAVWAAAAGFDRFLLEALLTPLGRQTGSIPTLEARADELVDLYQRLHAFRTRLEALPLHLGWLDRPFWKAVSEQWGLEPRLEGLVDRFETLEHVHSHLLEAVSGRRARRLGVFVLVFTVASVITFGITVINFSQTRLSSPRAENLRALVVLLALAAVVGIVAIVLARAKPAAAGRAKSIPTTAQVVEDRRRSGSGGLSSD